jgi:2-oxo-4-hydroxy-4-carboxy--5-ureidoimidazoline (OHCU) decarboxylase
MTQEEYYKYQEQEIGKLANLYTQRFGKPFISPFTLNSSPQKINEFLDECGEI